MPSVRTVFGSSPEPQIMNDPKSLYQSPFGCQWASMHPILQPAKVRKGNLALLDPCKDVLPDRPRKTRESDLRQWHLSRRLPESDPPPPLPYVQDRSQP